MALGAVIAIATPLVQSGVNALHATNAKDRERFASAQAWYQSAIQGDGIALCKLKYMGGTNGQGICGGEVSSGFATNEAKQYTQQLYNQALRVLEGTQAPSSALPTPPVTQSVAQTIGSVAGQVSSTSSQIGTILGQTPEPTGAQKLEVAKEWGGYLILALLIGGGAYFLLRRR